MGHAAVLVTAPLRMDDNDDYDPLARRCEQAKAWAAGSLAVLLGAFVLGIHLVVGAALIGVIFWSGRWIQAANRLREREAKVDDDDDEDEADQDGAPPSNIIKFPRQNG